MTLPHIEVTSGSQWNPNTVKPGKLYTDNDSDDHYQQHTVSYHTTETGKYSYLDNDTEKAIPHSIKPALVDIGAKLKRNISEIVTPAADEITAIRTPHPKSRHLKESSELIADMWCIGLKISRATLGATNQRGVRSDTLPLARGYKVDIFSS